MAYRIHNFDGLQLSEYLQDGDSQNMGTGEALTKFQQLPNGTFYDFYGSNQSPQGIRPIQKRCLLSADTSALLKTAMDNVRAKLGVRGKLTVQYDDGTLRWQWARLKTADMEEEWNAAATINPCYMEWVTAAQYWYEIINTPTEWTVGDSTWVLGDGTAETGENGTEETLTATGATGTGPPAGGTTQTINTTHGGNINAINMIWTITVGTNTITAIDFENTTTSESFYFNHAITTGEVLVIDCGAMNVTVDGVNHYADFTPDNRARWMKLVSGANAITVTVNGNAAQDATIGLEYYDHYA